VLALVIEKTVQNLVRLTACSSYNVRRTSVSSVVRPLASRVVRPRPRVVHTPPAQAAGTHALCPAALPCTWPCTCQLQCSLLHASGTHPSRMSTVSVRIIPGRSHSHSTSARSESSEPFPETKLPAFALRVVKQHQAASSPPAGCGVGFRPARVHPRCCCGGQRQHDMQLEDG
jgi:hypothetical protein